MLPFNFQLTVALSRKTGKEEKLKYTLESTMSADSRGLLIIVFADIDQRQCPPEISKREV